MYEIKMNIGELYMILKDLADIGSEGISFRIKVKEGKVTVDIAGCNNNQIIYTLPETLKAKDNLHVFLELVTLYKFINSVKGDFSDKNLTFNISENECMIKVEGYESRINILNIDKFIELGKPEEIQNYFLIDSIEFKNLLVKGCICVDPGNRAPMAQEIHIIAEEEDKKLTVSSTDGHSGVLCYKNIEKVQGNFHFAISKSLASILSSIDQRDVIAFACDDKLVKVKFKNKVILFKKKDVKPFNDTYFKADLNLFTTKIEVNTHLFLKHVDFISAMMSKHEGVILSLDKNGTVELSLDQQAKTTFQVDVKDFDEDVNKIKFDTKLAKRIKLFNGKIDIMFGQKTFIYVKDAVKKESEDIELKFMLLPIRFKSEE